MQYSPGQAIALTTLRVVIGWHFLYEGVSKLLTPGWSSRSYLLDSQGFLSWFYNWMANNDGVLRVADILNEWGLTLIGLALILGIFNRIATLSGMLLLLLYYFSHPAWIGMEFSFPSEGNYFIVNKNIVEIMALLVLFFFPTGHIAGIENLFSRKERKTK
jgi:thiosulfate dehydrogenase [quinone] large subunit